MKGFGVRLLLRALGLICEEILPFEEWLGGISYVLCLTIIWDLSSVTVCAGRSLSGWCDPINFAVGSGMPLRSCNRAALRVVAFGLLEKPTGFT